MNKHSIIFGTLICLSLLSHYAQANTDKAYTDDRRVQDSLTTPQPIRTPNNDINHLPMPSASQDNTVHLTANELTQHPRLLNRALGAALMLNDGERVSYLFTAYQQLPAHTQDAYLTLWAKAVLARHQQRYHEATQYYQQLLSQQDKLSYVQLQAIQTQLENRNFQEAEQQLTDLSNTPDLPEIIQQAITHYRSTLDNHHRWKFYGGTEYIEDNNINQAPQQTDLGKNWKAEEAQSAHGFVWQTGVSKKLSLSQGKFAEMRAHLAGKYYWDKKQYNETRLRISLGGGWQNAKHHWLILPFAEHTRYAGGQTGRNTMQPFSNTAGINTQWQYRFHPQWQLSTGIEYAQTRYQTRKHLNGYYYFAHSSLYHQLTPQQFWQLSIDHTHNHAQDPDDSYTRSGIHLTWGKEWDNGLFGQIGAGYAKRRYHGPMPVFMKTQNNREYQFNLSIGHKNVQFLGITPRLTWQYQKTNSNIPLYHHQKGRLMLELSKQF